MKRSSLRSDFHNCWSSLGDKAIFGLRCSCTVIMQASILATDLPTGEISRTALARQLVPHAHVMAASALSHLSQSALLFRLTFQA